MSKNNGLWELFEKTGLPEAYLAYREETVKLLKDTKNNGEQI